MYSEPNPAVSATDEERKKREKRDRLVEMLENLAERLLDENFWETLQEITELAKEVLDFVESCKTLAETETSESLAAENVELRTALLKSLRGLTEQAGNEAVEEGASRVRERLAAGAIAEGATISTSI